MKDLNRRSLFGWLAAAPLVVKGAAEALATEGDGIQALLEAGQRSVDPPVMAVTRAANGIIQTYAGGLTWVDSDYAYDKNCLIAAQRKLG